MEKVFVVTFNEYGYEEDDSDSKSVIGVFLTAEEAAEAVKTLYKERGTESHHKYDQPVEVDGVKYKLHGYVDTLVIPVGQFNKYGW